MTYLEILIELEQINLKNKFVLEFEKLTSPTLVLLIKANTKIYSSAAMIRSLMKHYEPESEKWLFWQKVLVYLMTPQFARKNNLQLTKTSI